ETRKTKRVRLFTEFVSRRLAAYAPLFAGQSIFRGRRPAGRRRRFAVDKCLQADIPNVRHAAFATGPDHQKAGNVPYACMKRQKIKALAGPRPAAGGWWASS